MEIDNINTKRMRNEVHNQFHTDVIRLIDEHPEVASKAAPKVGAYKSSFAKADAAFKTIIKSTLTKQIKEADKARDEAWTGLLYTNMGALRHPDPAVRASAEKLKIVFDTYGRMSQKSFAAQTSAITNIVQDLEGPYAQHVATVGLGLWLVEVKARNVTLANLIRDRDYEASERNSVALKAARAELDESYYAFVKLVNAFALVEGDSIYEPFIRNMNAKIARFLLLMPAPKRDKGNDAAGGAQTEG